MRSLLRRQKFRDRKGTPYPPMVKECLFLFSYDGDDITVSSPIRENTYMATPNELYEALDVLLDGVVDPREIIEKMGPDAADCHVNAPIAAAVFGR